jgi:hypothetical protein
MNLAEVFDGFTILMNTPGFPQILGFFSVVCVFLGAFIVRGNGYTMRTMGLVVLVLIVGEEVLRAVYFDSIYGIIRPNPIALALIVYGTMSISVLIGYFAKKWTVNHTTEEEDRKSLEEDIKNILKEVEIRKKEEAIKEATREVVEQSNG